MEPRIINRNLVTCDPAEVSAFVTQWIAPVRALPGRTGEMLGFDATSCACGDFLASDT